MWAVAVAYYCAVGLVVLGFVAAVEWLMDRNNERL